MGSERVEEADEVGLAGRRPWLEIRRRGRDGGPLEHRDAVRLSRAEVADDPSDRVSLMYASAKCNPPRITGRFGWLGTWTSPRGAAVSTWACTRRYETLSRASIDRRYVYS